MSGNTSAPSSPSPTTSRALADGEATRVTSQELHDLAQAGVFDAHALERALQLAGERPGAEDWRRFLSTASLVAGALLLGAAMVFFIAYNWEGMTRMAKIGLLGSATVTAAIAGAAFTPAGWPGRAALTAATLFLGALLAFVGQTYQTGADPWQLFGAWAVLALPWAVASGWPPLWCAILVVANIALGLYLGQAPPDWPWLKRDLSMFYALCGLNVAIVLVAEALRANAMARLFPRLAAVLVLGVSGAAAVKSIISSRAWDAEAFALFAAVLVAAYGAYRMRRVDLVILAAGALAAIVVATAALTDMLHVIGMKAALYLIGGAFVIAASAGAAYWLGSIAREEAGP